MSRKTLSPPASDTADQAQCTVDRAVSISQAIVRAARRGDRWPLWTALQEGIELAKSRAHQRGETEIMPWEPATEVTHIAWEDLQDVLVRALGTIPGTDERHRLIRAAAQAAESEDTKPAPKPGKYGRLVCALPGCGRTFSPQRPTARYCTPAHRHKAYVERKAARAAVKEDGKVTELYPAAG